MVGREGSTSRVVAILIVIQFPPLVDREETYLISTSCSREGYVVCKGGRERRENEISQPSQLIPSSPLISSSSSFSAADQELSYPYVSKQTSSLGPPGSAEKLKKELVSLFSFPLSLCLVCPDTRLLSRFVHFSTLVTLQTATMSRYAERRNSPAPPSNRCQSPLSFSVSVPHQIIRGHP